jgi:hypothetical protein
MKTLLSIAVIIFCATMAQGQIRLVRVLGQLISPDLSHWNDSSEKLVGYNSKGLNNQNIINYNNSQVTTTWQPGQKEAITYNNANAITNVSIYNWDNGTTAWETNTILTKSYNYTATGIDFIEWFYTATSNTTIDTFIYDNSNRLVERQTGNQKYLYAYVGNGKRIETLIQVFSNSAWVNNRRTTHTYANTGELISETEEYWDATNNAWVTNFRYTYTYNSNGTLDVILKEHLDGSTWNNFERYQHFYGTTTSTAKINSPGTFTVYPNPSNGVFTVDANFDEPATQITVYDVAGKPVLSQPATGNQTEINLSRVAKGIYILHLQTNSGVQTGKIRVE